MAARKRLRQRLSNWLQLNDVPSLVRRTIVGVFGFTVLLLGIVMLVLPGPAVVVIPMGLAILGTEYVWARRWLRKVRAMIKQSAEKIAPH